MGSRTILDDDVASLTPLHVEASVDEIVAAPTDVSPARETEGSVGGWEFGIACEGHIAGSCHSIELVFSDVYYVGTRLT